MAEPEQPAEPTPAGADAPPDGAPAPEPASPAAPAAPDVRVERLRVAIANFVDGNFAGARRGADEVLRGDAPPELKAQAEELLRRMGLDPVALWIAIGSTIFFVVVVVLTFRR
jgi:hypothetical protein